MLLPEATVITNLSANALKLFGQNVHSKSATNATKVIQQKGMARLLQSQEKVPLKKKHKTNK
jgi:hypothetical protein